MTFATPAEPPPRPPWDAHTLVCQLRDTLQRRHGPVTELVSSRPCWDHRPPYLDVTIRGRTLRRHLAKSMEVAWRVFFQVEDAEVVVEVRRYRTGYTHGGTLHRAQFDMVEGDGLDRLERWVLGQLEQLAGAAIHAPAATTRTGRTRR